MTAPEDVTESPEYMQPILLQLSPISLLPNETLVHIFRHGLDVIPHSACSLPLPITVGGVCRSWRTVALHTPELWTRVFVTAATPVDRLQTYLKRSGEFDIDASFCHWPVPKRTNEVNSNEEFIQSIVGAFHSHAHRLRSISLWDVSDTVVCTVTRALLNFDVPRLTSVSVKANHTAYNHYYLLHNRYLLPFLNGKAPSLTHLDIDYFPIETFRMRSDWPFNAGNLASLTLRTRECPTLGFFLPPYIIEFPALCALLRSTPNLVTLAFYGPIVEPGDDFLTRPEGVTLPLLETFAIHRRDPGIRYHCELLSVLTLPALKRLEIPWHDDLSTEPPYVDRVATYLLDGDGRPRFASVKELYLHDSAVKWRMPARSFVKAFPNLEEVMLGGGDVIKFAATLRGLVRLHPYPQARMNGRRVRGFQGNPVSVLEEGSWEKVRKVVLKEPEMAKWKGWVRGYSKWFAAKGHSGGSMCIEIRDAVPREDQPDDREMKAFRRGLERLGKHTQVTLM